LLCDLNATLGSDRIKRNHELLYVFSHGDSFGQFIAKCRLDSHCLENPHLRMFFQTVQSEGYGVTVTVMRQEKFGVAEELPSVVSC
jgi:hypothetical protein